MENLQFNRQGNCRPVVIYSKADSNRFQHVTYLMQLSKDLKGSIMIAFTMSGEWTKPKEAWERALENIALEFKKLRNEDVKNKRNKLEITQDRMADFLGITR